MHWKKGFQTTIQLLCHLSALLQRRDCLKNVSQFWVSMSRFVSTILTASLGVSDSHSHCQVTMLATLHNEIRFASDESTARKSPSRGSEVSLCGGRRVQGFCCACVWICRLGRADHARGTGLFGQAVRPYPCTLLEVGRLGSFLTMALRPGRDTSLWNLDVHGHGHLSCSLVCMCRR
jgi:hypothetical protein